MIRLVDGILDSLPISALVFHHVHLRDHVLAAQASLLVGSLLCSPLIPSLRKIAHDEAAQNHHHNEGDHDEECKQGVHPKSVLDLTLDVLRVHR